LVLCNYVLDRLLLVSVTCFFSPWLNFVLCVYWIFSCVYACYFCLWSRCNLTSIN
jgi:hypothetical protein